MKKIRTPSGMRIDIEDLESVSCAYPAMVVGCFKGDDKEYVLAEYKNYLTAAEYANKLERMIEDAERDARMKKLLGAW